MEKRSLGATNHEKIFPVLGSILAACQRTFKRSIQESSNFHGLKRISAREKFFYRRKKSQTSMLNLTLWTLKFLAALK